MYVMFIMALLMMIIQNSIYFVAAITRGTIIMKNGFNVFIGITKNVLYSRVQRVGNKES